MSQKRDTDYLAVSTRIHAMENRMLTRERMERMIDAKDSGEAAKVLSECGYGELTPADLGGAGRAAGRCPGGTTFRDMADSVPDRRLVEVFQLKYDYHNAKVLIKAQAMGLDEARLLSQGGRYDPQRLREDFLRDDLRDWGEVFRQAVLRAREVLSATGDPQQADLVLDRACFQEMESLARACGSAFLQGYVRLSVDAANLRAAVRAARMGKGSEFLNQILLPGGNVSERALAGARPEELAERFRSGPLAQAAALGAARTQPDSGPLTEFERLCDNAVTGYLASASRVPFGEETVIGYLYAREAEITAVRIIMAGRMAGLDGETIRSRLRATYV